jgi:hypothetical protein
MHTATTLPVITCGYEVFSLKLGEEYRQRVFNSRVLRSLKGGTSQEVGESYTMKPS